MDSLRGQLLIAGPTLEDPNFQRTVVLVGEHNEEVLAEAGFDEKGLEHLRQGGAFAP